MIEHQTEIGGLLHAEHVATMATLQRLEDVIASRRPPAPALLDDLLGRLNAEVGRHYGFEEEHLFPLFVELGEAGIVSILTSEHRTILPLVLQLTDMGTAARKDGFTDEGWKRFAEVAAELVEREVFHIQKEEMGLLSAIAVLLDQQTDARLAAVYRQVMAA